MNIYLIRHGRQNSRLCNVDVELSKEGREQAELAGERLRNYEIEVVYSSQLLRAKETADIINQYLDKPRVIDERWQEADFGGMTGLSDEEMKQKYGDFLAKRATMTEDVPYPDGGENCQMVFHRAFTALKDLAFFLRFSEPAIFINDSSMVAAVSLTSSRIPSFRYRRYNSPIEE